MINVLTNFVGVQAWHNRFNIRNLWLYNDDTNSTRAITLLELVTMLLSKN